MRVPCDDRRNPVRDWIDIEVRNVVHDVDSLTADVDDCRRRQRIGPRIFVVVAANSGDRRNSPQSLEDLGRADVARMNDVVDACERDLGFPAKQSVRVGDDANGLHVLGAHIELDANGELFPSGSQHHPNERALALTKADVFGLPQAMADFNGFYAPHENYVITNPKRNLLVVATAAVLLLIALVWGWRRMRRRKQS